MEKQRLGVSDLQVSRVAYGCMRIAGTWNPREITPAREEAARASLKAAYDAGYNFFDHADIYCAGACETLHGKFMRGSATLRNETILATKCGIVFGDPGHYNFSAEHITRSCEASLRRLGVDVIDLYQLHRPDLLMQPEEVALALTNLVWQGKVRYIGVSNFLPSTIDLLQSAMRLRLVSQQVEIHPLRVAPLYDGTLDQCQRQKLTPLSWSPLAQGRLGQDEPADEKVAATVKVLKALGEKHRTSPVNIAHAWLLNHPSQIIPIVGTTQPHRIREAAQATGIKLDRPDWYSITVAGQGHPMP